jgi:Tfp pilus assembly protein PilO
VNAALRRPAAVGALVALVLVGGWYKILWQPTGSAIAKASKQTSAASTNLYSVEQNIGHLKHLQLISPKLAVLEQQLSAAVPATDEMDQFLLTLNALIQQAGVDVGSISLAPPASSGSVSTIGVRFSVNGDYFAVQGFLDSLRASSRIIVIDSLSETPSSKSGSKAGDEVSASLAAHILSGLVAPVPAVQKLLTPTPPTTAAPTGIISGPVTKAQNAVKAANANTAQVNNQANAIGGN